MKCEYCKKVDIPPTRKFCSVACYRVWQKGRLKGMDEEESNLERKNIVKLLEYDWFPSTIASYLGVSTREIHKVAKAEGIKTRREQKEPDRI